MAVARMANAAVSACRAPSTAPPRTAPRSASVASPSKPASTAPSSTAIVTCLPSSTPPHCSRPHRTLQPPPASLASLQADLANAHARNTRLVTQTRRLERRLSELMGEQTWRESGLDAHADQEELQRGVSRLEQANTELLARLEEKDAELEAARAANRELTRALNQKGAAEQ